MEQYHFQAKSVHQINLYCKQVEKMIISYKIPLQCQVWTSVGFWCRI